MSLAIGIPTYKLCDQLLKPLINDEYNVKDSFSFAKKGSELDASLSMASFDDAIFHQHTSNRDVKPLCTKPLQKSNIFWEFD